MPAALPNRAEIMVAIVARCEAGETVAAVCRSPGMPTTRTVRNWMKTNDWFREALPQARWAGSQRRFLFDEAKAKEILKRAWAGEPMVSILRSPGMPSLKTVKHWLARGGPFRAEYERIKDYRWHMKGQRLKQRYRHFDEAVADRLFIALTKGGKLRALLRSDKAYPSLAVLERWRKARPEFDKALKFAMKVGRRERGSRLYSPGLAEEIVGRIVEGGSLRSIAQDPSMPCQRTLYNWVRKRSDFFRIVDDACEERNHWYMDQIEAIAARAVPGAVGETRKAMAPLNAQLARLQKRPGWKIKGGGRRS